jgi:hypothetical protein
VIKNNVIKKVSTERQTKKHRIERWKNVEDIFFITDLTSLEG